MKDYGVFNEEQGFGNRATFVIDKEGIIRHIDEGNVAIDPTSIADACNVLMRKKAVKAGALKIRKFEHCDSYAHSVRQIRRYWYWHRRW